MDTKLKYQRLIERAIKRGTPTKPFEKHHVVPQCFMKNDWTVNLTVAEHLLAHKYLAEMTQHPKLITAYYLMTTVRSNRVSDKEAVRIRNEYHAYLNSPEGKREGKQANKRLQQVHDEYQAIDPTYYERRGQKISLGKWGKVKLEYNGLCYYNKKYLAEDVGKTTRTITSWMKNGKVIVHNNESVTYDNRKRLTVNGQSSE